ERAAAGEYMLPRGELIITAPGVVGRLHVLPVVGEFLKAHAEIDIRLVLADCIGNPQEDPGDLAVRSGPIAATQLIARRAGGIGGVVGGSPAYFAERGTPTTPADLAAHDCITFGGLTASDVWTFTSGKSEIAVTVRSRLVVNTAEAAIDAAAAGLGITRVLSYQVADAVERGALVLALPEFEPSPDPVSLVYAGQGLLPLKLRAFLDFASPRLKARFS